VAYILGYNVDHCTRMDCGITLLISTYVLLVPYPGQESRFFAPVKPFQPMVGLCSILITEYECYLILLLNLNFFAS